MKFLHMSDCHLDAPFVELGQALGKANIRRQELKDTFSKAISLAKEHEVDAIFISGDLFEHKYVEKSTINYLDRKFRDIPDIRVFISPGNHDPAVSNSYYSTHKWPENVFIFGGNFEKIFIPELNTNIWGVGFKDFYIDKCMVQDIDRDERNKTNILVTHGTIDGGSDCRYHPIAQKHIASAGFDYCALGHMHKIINDDKNSIYNPGSIEPLGFDELGRHGVFIGEVNKDYKSVAFYPIARREYFIQNISVERVVTPEDLIDRIKISVNFESARENLYRINLIGKPSDELVLDIGVIEEGLKNYFYYIKIEDKTEVPYQLDELEKEYNLKGLFVKRMNQLIEKASPEEKEGLMKALHYGLDALAKGEVKI